MVDFSTVTEFEKKIAEFFGAPFAVAVDSCTHGIELCLRYTKSDLLVSPRRTYLSVPMLHKKIGISISWLDSAWYNWYMVSEKVADCAVLWCRGSYINGLFMCVSFQYQKHLSVGRLGVILCDNEQAAIELKKMSYDGRLPGIPWREQDIDTVGYHYYATPEACQIALDKLPKAIITEPRKWTYQDYPDVSKMKVFSK